MAPELAVAVAEPIPLAVARPELLMLMVGGDELDHWTELVKFCWEPSL